MVVLLRIGLSSGCYIHEVSEQPIAALVVQGLGRWEVLRGGYRISGNRSRECGPKNTLNSGRKLEILLATAQ
jgi:hypothetical protein